MLGYDAAGNVISNGTTTYSYDAENHLTQYSGSNGTFTYTYDGDGKRVMKSGGPIYWYGVDSTPYMETDLTSTEQHTYFRWNGRLIARSMPTNEYDFYIQDHLGNTRRLSTLSGDNQSDFYPFGGERSYISTDNSTLYKFTGKERDSESGLDNFGARYYASTMGRFMTPDWSSRPSPVPYASVADPQTLNLYRAGGPHTER